MAVNYADYSAEVSVFNNNMQQYIHLTMLQDANGNAITDAQGNKTYQYISAPAQLMGGEINVSIHPSQYKGWRWDNTIAVVYGFNRNKLYNGKGNAGEYLPLIPPTKIISTLSKNIENNSKLLASVTPFIEAEYHNAQNRYLGLNNTETFTASYLLINTGISAEIKYNQLKKATFSIQANNLFNAVYQSHLSRLKYFEYYSQSPDNSSGIYNMGSNICLKLAVNF